MCYWKRCPDAEHGSGRAHEINFRKLEMYQYINAQVHLPKTPSCSERRPGALDSKASLEVGTESGGGGAGQSLPACFLV